MRSSDVRGVTRLALAATVGVVDLVEAMHDRIARTVAIPDTPVHAATREVTRLVYRSIRGATGAIGTALDATLARLGPLLGEAASTADRDALLAALNGVVGDHLAASGNPLAIPMQLRCGGRPLDTGSRLAVPAANGRVLVLVHGLCMNHRQWARGGHDHGAALARDLGFTAVHLHYNTGLHVSTNGRAFAHLLEELVRRWPVPVRELVILGHSMGGLVARSACHYGRAAGLRWPRRLRTLVFLATPHHGAPLERGGHWIDVLLSGVPWTRPLGRLGRIRSAGITDLRHGNLLDEDWQGCDRFARTGDRRRGLPLPEGVACHAIAATVREHVGGRGRLPGDGLVPVDSALGRHHRRWLALGIPRHRRWVVPDTGHLDLLGSRTAYARIRQWVAAG